MKSIKSFYLFVGVWVIFPLLWSEPCKAQASYIVSTGNYSFSPSQLTINVGDTVIWENIDGSHNVNGTQTTFPSNPESFGNDVGTDWVYKHVFAKSGTYDYQCDPHVGQGMVGKVFVNDNSGEDAKLTIHFIGMTPHVGQEFTGYLKDAETKEYHDTVKLNEIVSADFDIIFSDIMTGSSYEVDFYADLNGNETYDAPPVDHAWRLSVNDVQGDVVIDFEHNTSFTDIFAVATDLDLLKESMGLQVYPNPAVDFVLLTFSENTNDIVLLNVYNSTGSILTQKVIDPDQESFLFDVGSFKQGLYFLEAVSGSWKEVVSLVKQ